MYYLPSTWRRLAAHFFDKGYIAVLQSPVWIIIIFDFIKTELIRISWPHILYLVSVSIGYEALSLYFFSATLGKWQWGLRVIDRQASDPQDGLGFTQSLIRVFVSRFNFYFGWSIFALAFFKYNRTHLGDWIAETQVVSLHNRWRQPRIKWVLGSVLVLMTASESLKTASMTLNSLHWDKPFIYFESKALKQWVENIEVSIDQDEDEDN